MLAPGETGNPATAVWMGGAHSLAGEVIEKSHLRRAWLVDCAGDMPLEWRPAALMWLPLVFADLDVPLNRSLRLEETVARLASAVAALSPPEAVYVMCTHGMNRSGLVTGLLLRALGVPGDEAIARVRAARPGALSNQQFHNRVRYG